MSGMSFHSVHCLDCGTVTSGISGGEFGAFRAAIGHIIQAHSSNSPELLTLDQVVEILK